MRESDKFWPKIPRLNGVQSIPTRNELQPVVSSPIALVDNKTRIIVARYFDHDFVLKH